MTDDRCVTVALPKGRLAQLTLGLFEASGVDCSELRKDGRKLVFEVEGGIGGDGAGGAADGAGGAGVNGAANGVGYADGAVGAGVGGAANGAGGAANGAGATSDGGEGSATSADGVDASNPSNASNASASSSSPASPSVLYRFLLVKPSDVPTYVDHGVADIGVAGKDTLLEENRPLYEMLDLGFGRCRMCVAGFPESRRRAGPLRVATKFPAIASRFYAARGEDIEIIKLNGSVELGPIVGLSDVIVDIVESGSTLKANGLAVLEDVCEVSARLVVNRVSLKTKGARIKALMKALQGALEAGARG